MSRSIKYLVLAFVIFVGVLLSPSALLAQQANPANQKTSPEETLPVFSPAENELVCSEYYQEKTNFTFVSNLPFKTFVPGQVFSIEGSLKNNGPLVVGDGSLYAVIRKGNASSTATNLAQFDAVEYIELGKNISLAAGGESAVKYDWQVPQGLPKGKYHIQLRLVQGEKIILPVATSNLNFEVKEGSSATPITLVGSGLSKKDGKKILSLSFKNNSNERRTVPVTVNIYSGAEINGKPVQTIIKNFSVDKVSTENIIIPFADYIFPGKLITVTYAPDVTGKAMRFIYDRDFLKGTPVVFAGGLSRSGGDVTAFSCVRNTEFSGITKLKTVISVIDGQNNIINGTKKEIISTSTAMATTLKLTDDDLKEMKGDIKLAVDIYKGNSLVSKTFFKYSCGDDTTKNDLCGRGQSAGGIKSFFDKYKNILFAIVGISVLFWILSLLGYTKIKKMFSAFFFVLISAASLATFIPSEAAAQTWQSEFKSILSPGNHDYSNNLLVQIGKFSSTWYGSAYFLNDTNKWVNYTGSVGAYQNWIYSKGTTENTPTAPSTPAYQSFLNGLMKNGATDTDRHGISLPLWYGVYIVTDGVAPVNLGTGGSSASAAGFNYDAGNYWATNVKQGQMNATTSAWQIPLGTRIGFYISPKQAAFPGADKFFWWQMTEPDTYSPSYLGEYVSSLSIQLSPCSNDLKRANSGYDESWYREGYGYPTRSSNPCGDDTATTFRRNYSLRMVAPSFSISGLDNFSCESLQSDGTMECVAVSVGTSTPVITMTGGAGRVYGVTSYKNGTLGTCNYQYLGDFSCRHSPYTAAYSAIMMNPTILYQPDQTPMAVYTDPSARADGYTGGNSIYVNAIPASLADGQPGFTLPSVSFRPFGSIKVSPGTTYAPSAPTVSTVGSPWAAAGGGVDYLFSAVSTDADSNDGILYQVDWDKDGNYDLETHLSVPYQTSTNSSVAQPGYTGSSLFAWDTNAWYTTSGSAMRFNRNYTQSGAQSFKVRAVDRYNNASSWTTYNFTAAAAPTTPQNFTATTASSCGGGVALSWSAVSGVTGYKIYKYNNTTGANDLLATVSSGTLSYADTSVAAPEEPYYLISSYNATGESQLGGSNVVAAASACGPLLPPDSLTAVAGSCGGKIDLTWTEGSGATGYYIERFDEGPQTWTRIATATSTQRTYTDTPGISVSQTYRIQSVQNSDVSDYNQFPASVESSAACNPPLPPVGPSGSTSSACGGKINFGWTNPGGSATEYRLYRTNVSYVLVAVIPVSAISYEYTQTDYSQGYYAMSGYNSATGLESGYVAVNYGASIQPSSACVATTQCSDNIDNDGNGLTDFDGNAAGLLPDTVPPNPNCSSLADNYEAPGICTRGTVQKSTGDTYKFYSTKLASSTTGCESYSKVLVCNSNGFFTDQGGSNNYVNYKYDYCRLNANVRER